MSHTAKVKAVKWNRRKLKPQTITQESAKWKLETIVEQSEDISTSVQVCLPKVFLCLLLNLFIDFMSAV